MKRYIYQNTVALEQK